MEEPLVEVFFAAGPLDGESLHLPHSQLSEDHHMTEPPADSDEVFPRGGWPHYRLKLTLDGWIYEYLGPLSSDPELLAKLQRNAEGER
jgi:hypothetical protein